MSDDYGTAPMIDTDGTVLPAVAERVRAAAQAAANLDPAWRAAFVAALHDLAADGAVFTADDVRTAADLVAGPVTEPRGYGALIAAARRDGLIEPAGAAPLGGRHAAHHRRVTLWRGVAG